MKFLNLNKSYAYILSTILCLVFLGATYFFIYLPKNEKNVEEQRFRTLQNIDKNIHEKIENSLSLIKNLIDTNKISNYDSLNTYIETYSKNKFTLSPIDTIRVKGKGLRDSVNNLPKLLVDDATKDIILVSKRELIRKDTPIIQGSVRYSFKQFIQNLLPGAVFDEYIIFSKNNTVYESFPSGISAPKEDSLLDIQNGIGGSYARDITIGGKDYKLFIQPVTFDSSNKWILGGLLLKKRYQQERSELPTAIVMLLVTMVLAMIVIFPWIKLYQMGSKDRLTLIDGASSIVVSMLLMSLLFFCFFKYNKYARYNSSPDSKTILATTISKAFCDETKKMYSLLKSYNDFKLKHEKITDIANLLDTTVYISFHNLKPTIQKGILKLDSADKHTLESLNVPKIDQVFWMDSDGNERYNWTAKSMNAPHGNFKVRDYFDHIIHKKNYYIDGDTTKGYYLDQVISWITGTFQSVISMPVSDSNVNVGAISFTMRSVQDVVLPTGYSFAIINNTGNVLYHSISGRNLNENLKSEFTDSTNLISFINARSEGEFYTRYYSKNYTIRITPIKNLPYFIVIFSDNGYSDIRDVETYSFTFSMLLLIFLYIALQLCITLLLSSRRSFFKKQLFDTSWIGPKTSCHRDYLISFILNTLMILILITFFQKMDFLQYLFLLFFAFTFAPLCINILFVIRYSKEKKINNRRYKLVAVNWLSSMLIVINITACNMLENKHCWQFIGLELAIIGIGALFIYYADKTIDNCAAYLNKYADKCAEFLEKTVTKHADKIKFATENEEENKSTKEESHIGKSVKKYVIRYIKNRLISIKMFLSDSRNYIKTFSLMALTGLIITSGIPVAFFYVTSFNYEQNLGIRQKQIDYANRLLEQPALTLDSLKDKLHLNYNKTGIYYDSSWISKYPLVYDTNFNNITFNTIEYKHARKILNSFHLRIGDQSMETDQLYYPTSADNSIIYNPLFIHTIGDSSITTYKQTNIAGRYLKLDSYNLDYRLRWFSKKSSFLYWVFLALTLIIFYFIIINILKKLFSLNLPNLDTWKQLDDKIIGENKDLNNLLFIIGLPGAGKLKYIKDKIADKENPLKYIKGDEEIDLVYNEKNMAENNVLIADLINMPDTGAEIENDPTWKKFCAKALDDKYRLIIINHFEYNIQDEYTNLAKLNFLEQLMLRDKSKIMILSTVHPISFLDSLNEVNRKMNVTTSKEDTTAKRSYDLERWTVLLGHYRIVLIKIKKEVIENIKSDKNEFPIIKTTTDLTETDKVYESRRQLITRETDYTHYLKSMQECTLKIIDLHSDNDDIMVKTDELAYQLQVTAHYFYMYIWQSLTKEEKFLLYDLAEDNLVNSYDNYNLTMLIAKGVILQVNGSLQFFNKGFKNFILTAIGNTEAMKIKDRIKENGNWSKLRTPFLIIILAILSFLFISQQEAYSKLIAYAVALSAGIPTVLKLFSLFDKNATKANT